MLATTVPETEAIVFLLLLALATIWLIDFVVRRRR